MRIKKKTLEPVRALSNPLAYRVLTTIGMRGRQTTSELACVLRDVPTSSLYRQLARLRKVHLLRVVRERRARGAIERTYAVSSGDVAAFGARNLAKATTSELRSTLRNFLVTMTADLSTFIESRAFARNRLRVNAALSISRLTDDEYVDTVRKVNAVLMRSRARSVAKSAAKRRYFYVVALPEMVTP